MANDINKEDPHYKGEYGSIYEVNRKYPTGGVAGDFVVIEGWAHYWNADRATWCVNAERDSYWDELITSIIEKFKLVRGATYMGVASLDTVPAKVIGAKMYYFATVAGTYKNFGDLVVPQGINVLYSENGSSWVNTTLLEVAQELGVSTKKVVSQKALNDALNLKANQGSVNEALAKKADKETVNTELAKKFDKESVVQESGEAEDKVMSQKAVSDKLSDLTLLLSTNQFVVLGKKDGYIFDDKKGTLVSGYENYYVTDKIDFYGVNFTTNILTASKNVEVYCWDSEGNYLGVSIIKSYSGIGNVVKANVLANTASIAFLGLKGTIPTINFDFSIPQYKQNLLFTIGTIFGDDGFVIPHNSTYFTTNKISYLGGTVKTNILTASKNVEVYCWDSEGNYLGYNSVHRPYVFPSDIRGGTSYVAFLGIDKTGDEYVLMEAPDNMRHLEVDNNVVYRKSRNINTGKFQEKDSSYLTTKIIPYCGRLLSSNMKYGSYNCAVYCFDKHGQFLKGMLSYSCSEILPKGTCFIGVSCNQDMSGKELLLEPSKNIQSLSAGRILRDGFDLDEKIINLDYDCEEGEGKLSQIYKVESNLSMRYKYLFNYDSPAKEFRFLDDSFEPLIGAFTKQGGVLDGYARINIPPTASYIQFCAPKGFSYNSDYYFSFENEKFSNQIDLIKEGLRWRYNVTGINTEVDDSINLEKNGGVQSASVYDSPYMRIVAYFRITSDTYNVNIGSEGGYSASMAQIKGDANSATLTFFCGSSAASIQDVIGEPIAIPALPTKDGSEIMLVAEKTTDDDNQFEVSLFGVDGSLIWSHNMDYSKDANVGDKASMSGRPLFAIYEDTEATLFSCKICFNKYTKENPRIIVIGHSFVEGNSMFGQKSKTFTHLLELSLGTDNVVVTGLGGDTTEGIFKRSQRYLSKYNKAEYCFIVTGTNDSVLDSYKEYLDRITKWCKAYNIKPIYTTVPRLRGQEQSELYSQMTLYVATLGEYVDMRRVLASDNMFVDTAHPNAEGHKSIYNLLGAIEPSLNG